MAELGTRDFVVIMNIVNNILFIFSFLFLLPLGFAFYHKEADMIQIFTSIFIVLFIVSLIFKLFIFRSHKGKDIPLKDGMISLFLAWIAISVISSLPFMYSGFTLINSFFESFSGWTGTGLTMISDPAMIPVSLVFWRALIQWAGGLGVVILSLFILEGATASNLFKAEGRQEGFYINLRRIGKFIIIVYLFYTLALILFMFLFGAPLFDSTINIMTAIATGGFSNTTQGMDIYGFMPTIILLVAMVIGAISFEVHHHLAKRNFKAIFKNSSLRVMIVLILSSSLMVFLADPYSRNFFLGKFFYIVSALTGTGHVTSVSVASLSIIPFIVIILLMLTGGMYGSTSGAVKLWRVAIVYKAIKRQLTKAFLPESAIVPISVDGKNIDDDVSLKALSYIALYLLLILAASFIFLYNGYTAKESVFTVVSAQGNVGLNILGDNLIDIASSLKVLLIILMLLGRIEIIPFFIFIKSFTKIRGV